MNQTNNAGNLFNGPFILSWTERERERQKERARKREGVERDRDRERASRHSILHVCT